jgi:hypothetical protein
MHACLYLRMILLLKLASYDLNSVTHWSAPNALFQ